MLPRSQACVRSGADTSSPWPTSVYRQPLPPTDTDTDAPPEMMLAQSRGRVDYSLVFFIVIPYTVGLVVHMKHGPIAGLCALIAASAVSYAVRRLMRVDRDVVLRVEDRTLRVLTPGRAPRIVVRIEDVLDVRMAVTNEPGMTSTQIVTLQPFASGEASGLSTRRAKIAIVRRHGPDVWLTEHELIYQDGIVGLGKTRSFLRKHGWLPLDEREDDPIAFLVDDEEDDDDAPPSSADVRSSEG